MRLSSIAWVAWTCATTAWRNSGGSRVVFHSAELNELGAARMMPSRAARSFHISIMIWPSLPEPWRRTTTGSGPSLFGTKAKRVLVCPLKSKVSFVAFSFAEAGTVRRETQTSRAPQKRFFKADSIGRLKKHYTPGRSEEHTSELQSR